MSHDVRGSSGGWSRRSFLRLSIGSAATVAGSLVAGSAVRPAGTELLTDRLARLVPVASARAIGGSYLQIDPAAHAPGAILAALREKVSRHDLERTPDSELLRALRARIRQDFRDGDTVRLDGWILARTEVLVCALVAQARTAPR